VQILTTSYEYPPLGGGGAKCVARAFTFDPEMSYQALLAQKPGFAARERVIAHFSWDEVIDQHLEVYGHFVRS